MSTGLYEAIVFGPIISRRLGHSLGVNLLPQHGKWCNFNCIYCECGWNEEHTEDKVLPDAAAVKAALEHKLQSLKEAGESIDTITFSGNGEPTLNPHFPEIIDNTIELRNSYFPKAVISVLSNATRIHIKEVREALMKVNNPILKIDSPDPAVVDAINKPAEGYSLERVIENMRLFKGNFILQTMFLKGECDGTAIDCTNPELCRRWRELALSLRPRMIMMYTLDRETPAKNLSIVTIEEMEEIAAPLRKEGLEIQIKGPSRERR